MENGLAQANDDTTEHKVGRKNNNINDYIARNAPDLGTVVNTGTVASQFPSRVGHGHPDDQMYALKSKMLGKGQTLPGVGLAMATNEDFRYFQQKELDAREADFKRFFLSQIDLSSPEKQDYYQRLYPEIFNEREQLAEKQIEHQAHMLKIQLRGPRSMEDWQFLYGIDRGFIQFPKGPIYDPTALLKTSFQGGLFSIRHILPRQERVGFLPEAVQTRMPGAGQETGYTFDWTKGALNNEGRAGLAGIAALPATTGARKDGYPEWFRNL